MRGSTRTGTDVVIVGAGHNGLVAAFYLARAGLRVRVLEARSLVGGAVATEELIDGFRFSTCAFRLWGLQAPVIHGMGLAGRVTVRKPEPAVLRLYPDGRALKQWSDLRRTAAELESFSPGSSARLADWSSLWQLAGALYEPFVLREPPSESELRARSALLCNPDLYDTLRTADMASLVRGHFADEAVQGAYIAAPADPRQPGSPLEIAWASVPLEPDWSGLPVGGMGAVASAMAEAAAGAGAQITTDAPVTRILVGDRGAAGVELGDGSRLDAGIVVSNLSPRATYTRLVDPGALHPSFLDRVEGISSTIGYLKLHAALREPMDLSRYLGPDHDPVAGSYMRITRSIDHYISAWEDSAAGRPARDPVIQLGTHTALDPASAPPGGHAVSALVLYAPPVPENGTWNDLRTSAAEDLIDRITEYVPNFRRALVDYVLFTPADLEHRLGMVGGDIHHGDHLPGQFFTGRPFPDSGGWRSPIAGLYLCGAGTHPGGEVTGAPGYNCAAAILADRKGWDRPLS